MNINRYTSYSQTAFKQALVLKKPGAEDIAAIPVERPLGAVLFGQKENPYAKGYKDGIMVGFNKGFQDGYQKGMEEGFIKGHEIGYEEGQTNIPSRFMTGNQIA